VYKRQIGYFGGIVSGLGVGQIAQHWGWSTAMGVLAGLCIVAGVILAFSLNVQTKKVSNLL
ncbi:MAG: hypothetical protein ABL949_13945, partial [Fimbriimonadaceae bacterium]